MLSVIKQYPIIEKFKKKNLGYYAYSYFCRVSLCISVYLWNERDTTDHDVWCTQPRETRSNCVAEKIKEIYTTIITWPRLDSFPQDPRDDIGNRTTILQISVGKFIKNCTFFKNYSSTSIRPYSTTFILNELPSPLVQQILKLFGKIKIS